MIASLGYPEDGAGTAVTLLAYLLVALLSTIGLLLYGGLFYLAYFLFSLPMRRQERARFFLDLVESGLTEGRSPEATIVHLAKSRDRVLGHRFHLLAACLESGQRLTEALQKVPTLMPPQVTAMLAVGEQVGDIRKVLPACRQTLTGSRGKLTSAMNYLVIMVVNPFGLFGLLVWPFISFVLIPKFREIMGDLSPGRLPALMQFLQDHRLLFGMGQLTLLGLIWLAVVVYLCGPRSVARVAPALKPSFIDRVNDRLPWRRKRLQRDFSAMLAVLLDAGVPEELAVTLAARSTDNGVFIQRAREVVRRLQQGEKLTEAVQALDDTGEFRWRLANATHAHRGFLEALAGWHDALEAKAYQQEQAFSQVVTTGLVIFNGILIGLLCVAVFQPLIQIVHNLALW